jgi:decaprenylphospho-beta-D-erythro-pentofuranosid-2-ulose 2-reductase
VNDAFGHPQSVVVLGGTSDIARSVMVLLAHERCRSLVLAGRDVGSLEAVAASFRPSVAKVEAVPFDADNGSDAEKTVAACFDAAGEPVDLVVMAVGDLGDPETDEDHPDRVAHVLTVNTTWPASALSAVAAQLRVQGHGRILVLSSVAGYRVRRANFVYGSAKAGLDAFAIGLGEALRGSGVTVHVVRPGFVHTKMTAGLRAAPFSVGPDQVAADIVRGLHRGEAVIWSPPFLRWVFSALGLLPQGLWRRLPG